MGVADGVVVARQPCPMCPPSVPTVRPVCVGLIV
jgi:hypothetical protein